MDSFISSMTLIFNSLLTYILNFLNLVVSQPILLAVIALFVLRKIVDVFKTITG